MSTKLPGLLDCEIRAGNSLAAYTWLQFKFPFLVLILQLTKTAVISQYFNQNEADFSKRFQRNCKTSQSTVRLF